MKVKLTIIATIVAGGILLLTPAFGVQENLTESGGVEAGLATTAQLLNPGSWVRGWGEPDACSISRVTADNDGNIYAAGSFKGTVDFDPGPGVDEHTSNGGFDFYVLKLDSSGNYLWARTWGGPEIEIGLNMAPDEEGGVYLTGDFSGSVDFDPGAGIMQGVSNGYSDIFLSKLDSDGNFVWAVTWGGEHHELGGGVAVDDSGQVYAAGTFRGDVDFDPGPGVVTESPAGNWPGIYLSKFSPSGELQWVRIWGGNVRHGSLCDDVCVDRDGNVYVIGDFGGETDFNPGDGIDLHSSNGMWDIFLSKFDGDGMFQWARTWGGYYDDMAQGVEIDMFGNIFVSGACSTPGMSFDAPAVGEGIGQPGSEGSLHMSLAAFDSSGILLWAREWGGLGIQFCPDLAADSSGNAYVSEFYQVVGGLDPELVGTDIPGRFASTVVRFDLAGRFLRYYEPGDIFGTGELHLAIDGSDNLLIGGSVEEADDFDARLMEGDYMGSPDPGAFLIKLAE